MNSYADRYLYYFDPISPVRTIRRPEAMPFVAHLSVIGVPDFGIVKVDAEQTAIAFQAYLDTASNLTGISLDDINCSVIKMPVEVSKVTLADLLAIGMKLFDAVIWLTANRPASHPLKVDPAMKKESIPSMHEVARSVFYCYFMLVTQARYPAGKMTKEQPKIPNFLKTIMGMTKDQSEYVEMICSFEPQKFDPKWARFVKFEGFGQEVLSRFGLGVAGYRMFGPFGLYAPKADMDASLLPAFDFARSVAKSPASWDVHPLTRNPNVLTSRGNLNKNLGNLILEAFTEEDIKEMVDSKIIFAKPTREPTHRNYKQWVAVNDVSGTSFIFN
jgi:hypothetical protein